MGGEGTAINVYLGFTIFFLLALLQSTLGPFLSIGGVQPDLVFILVVAWAILRGFYEGLFWAFIGGLALDLLSGAPFGVFTLGLLGAGFLASLAHGRTFGNPVTLPLLLALPLSFVFNGLSLLLLQLLGRPISWGIAYRSILFPAALYNVGAMLLLFPLIYGLFRLSNRGQIDIV